MNANELADKLQNEKANTLLYVATIVDSANMLRQQQAEIEQLKKVLKEIIDISDRKHDVWDEAKELLQKERKRVKSNED